MVDQGNNMKGRDKKIGSIRSIFMHADGVDKWLMGLGFIGAVFDGVSDRLPLLFAAKMMNFVGNSSRLDPQVLQHSLNKVSFLFLSL